MSFILNMYIFSNLIEIVKKVNSDEKISVEEYYF